MVRRDLFPFHNLSFLAARGERNHINVSKTDNFGLAPSTEMTVGYLQYGWFCSAGRSVRADHPWNLSKRTSDQEREKERKGEKRGEAKGERAADDVGDGCRTIHLRVVPALRWCENTRSHALASRARSLGICGCTHHEHSHSTRTRGKVVAQVRLGDDTLPDRGPWRNPIHRPRELVVGIFLGRTARRRGKPLKVASELAMKLVWGRHNILDFSWNHWLFSRAWQWCCSWSEPR